MSTLEKRSDVTIMLLGPGEQYLQYRQQVRDELEIMGYNVIIMEEAVRKAGDGGLGGKFERIVTEKDPTLFVAFFHKDIPMAAVIYEIGFIDCYYGSHNISRKLRILYEKKFDFGETTAYMQTLFSANVPCVEIDEAKNYGKASEIIHNFVVNIPEISD